jgi:hypothetical protein
LIHRVGQPSEASPVSSTYIRPDHAAALVGLAAVVLVALAAVGTATSPAGRHRFLRALRRSCREPLAEIVGVGSESVGVVLQSGERWLGRTAVLPGIRFLGVRVDSSGVRDP